MTQIVALIAIVGLVFGSLFLASSHTTLHALPTELSLILGAGLCSVVIGNAPSVAKEALGGLVKAFTGSKWKRADYESALTLIYTLQRRAKTVGFVGIENDIENPETSELFRQHPRFLRDKQAISLLCEGLRTLSVRPSDAAGLSEQLNSQLDQIHTQRMRAVSALHTLADALPALGIVAAVLGIIRTMAHIDQSTAVLGGMIAAALLGTFLGVFLAYGIVGPIASRYGQIVEEEVQFLDVIKSALDTFAAGATARAATESARLKVPVDIRPTASDLSLSTSKSQFVSKHKAVA